MRTDTVRFWGAAGGMKEDKASRGSFFQWLRSRSLDEAKFIIVLACRKP